VSSPGIERPLFSPEDYTRFIGKKARIRVRVPVHGRKSLSGRILSADENAIDLEIDADVPEERAPVRIPFDIITKGNLAFEEKKDKRRNS
jgi:ribosome maturation factor RimP